MESRILFIEEERSHVYRPLRISSMHALDNIDPWP